MKINRQSSDDAKRVIDSFFNHEDEKNVALSFLTNAIVYANHISQKNWNVNLDPTGMFIRFNVGHEYCIEIFKNYVSVLVLKKPLYTIIGHIQGGVQFKGYKGKKKVLSPDIDQVCDCLVKVPDSVACHVKHSDLLEILPHLEQPNKIFIQYAIENTVQLPSMNKAHSPGVIAYLSKHFNRPIPNPDYSIRFDDFIEFQNKEIKKAAELSDSELLKKIEAFNKKGRPSHTTTILNALNRNPYVVALAKRRANGICQDCMQPAPFLRKDTNEPFLEVHHIHPIGDDGPDSIENTIALCPNCHRKRHYG